MLKPTLIVAIFCLMFVGSASAIDAACDATGKKYSEMLKNGRPFSKQDEVCMVAAMNANNAAYRKSNPIPKVSTAPAPKWGDLGKKQSPASGASQ